MNATYKIGPNGERIRVIASAPVLSERSNGSRGYEIVDGQIRHLGFIKSEQAYHPLDEIAHARLCERVGRSLDFYAYPAGSDDVIDLF